MSSQFFAVSQQNCKPTNHVRLPASFRLCTLRKSKHAKRTMKFRTSFLTIQAQTCDGASTSSECTMVASATNEHQWKGAHVSYSQPFQPRCFRSSTSTIHIRVAVPSHSSGRPYTRSGHFRTGNSATTCKFVGPPYQEVGWCTWF